MSVLNSLCKISFASLVAVVLAGSAQQVQANEKLAERQKPDQATQAFVNGCIENWDNRSQALSVMSANGVNTVSSSSKYPKGFLVYPGTPKVVFLGGIYDGLPNVTLRCRVSIRGYWAGRVASEVAASLSKNGYRLIEDRNAKPKSDGAYFAIRGTFKKGSDTFAVSVAQGRTNVGKETVLNFAKIGD
ncbi:hypothetical protein [Rhodovulum sp. FJ3]|uniref:hypothetical protein n=1 Tax=Rhodovulum sp. FJ3 TaxID=3079053 RepID=UPI00293DF7D4|nr:hypothetical protein [Rhodovulum sp. FJ3]MDV4168651.1 hypothetical protein [Rhodovulum sp. FJ3]